MSEKSWRPEGWKNPYPINPAIDYPMGFELHMRLQHEAFEAGADAMVAGLRKRGIHTDTSSTGFSVSPKFISQFWGTGIMAKGTLVFLPDPPGKEV